MSLYSSLGKIETHWIPSIKVYDAKQLDISPDTLGTSYAVQCHEFILEASRIKDTCK
jgi:hypothetical protein